MKGRRRFGVLIRLSLLLLLLPLFLLFLSSSLIFVLRRTEHSLLLNAKYFIINILYKNTIFFKKNK